MLISNEIYSFNNYIQAEYVNVVKVKNGRRVRNRIKL